MIWRFVLIAPTMRLHYFHEGLTSAIERRVMMAHQLDKSCERAATNNVASVGWKAIDEQLARAKAQQVNPLALAAGPQTGYWPREIVERVDTEAGAVWVIHAVSAQLPQGAV